MSEYRTEADVESKYAYSILVKEILEIPEERVNLHVPVRMTQGRASVTKEADIVLLDKNGNIMCVIESKAPTENLEKYLGQVDSYAFYLEAPISILTNYYRMIVRTYLANNKKKIVLDMDIDSLLKSNYAELKEIINEWKQDSNIKLSQKNEK